MQFNSLWNPVCAFTAGKMGKTFSQLDNAMSAICKYSGWLTCQLDNKILAKISQLGLPWSEDTEQVGQVDRFVSTSLKTIGLRCYLPVHFKGLLTRWPVLINVITLCPFYSMFQIKNLDWAHVPFLCCLLTEQLCPGHILATAEPDKPLLSCLSQGNLIQVDLGALKKHGEGEEKERWGILGNSSKEEYRQEHPAVFSSDVTQAECSPLKWLHSAVQ